jgi:Na+-driven multidrug efflux pump
MWIALIVIGSLASASSINMTLRLGKMNPYGARQAGYVGIALSAAILVLLGNFVLVKSRLVARIFTEDEFFLDMFQEASLPFTLTLCFMNLSVAIERVPYAMGRTREIFWMGFIGSWFGQVPGVFCMTRYWRDDLVGLYSGMAIGYAFLCILYGWITIRRYVGTIRRCRMPCVALAFLPLTSNVFCDCGPRSDWVKYAEFALARSESNHPSSTSPEK